MTDSLANYSTVILDLGSGITKAGFGGEDGPRSVFNSFVGIPKMPGLLVGMEQKERYVGEEAISKLEIMDYTKPIRKGEIVDWNKYETLLHHIFYDQLKVVPEEVSILINEAPLSSKESRRRLAKTLFETFNVEKIHIANTAMLGLYAYGKTSGLVLDCGYGVTTSVPIYEGYPLPHASVKLNFGGENLSETLLAMIQHNVNSSYKGVKGELLADDIKEKLGYVALNSEEEEKYFIENSAKSYEYTLPDKKTISLGSELFKHSEFLFKPTEQSQSSIHQMIVDSLSKCDPEIKHEIEESVCLTGGTSLLKGFPDRLKNELLQSLNNSNFSLLYSQERQFSNWLGGSIVTSLSNFADMWVSKQEYDEIGDALEAVDSKCF